MSKIWGKIPGGGWGMRTKCTWLMAMLWLAVLAGTPPAATTKDLYKDLGTFGGDTSTACCI
jgi:hypothetical protein